MVSPGKTGTTSPAFLLLLSSSLPHRGAHGLAARAQAERPVVGFPAAEIMLSSPVPEAAVGGGMRRSRGSNLRTLGRTRALRRSREAAGSGGDGPESPGASLHTGADGRQLLIV